MQVKKLSLLIRTNKTIPHLLFKDGVILIFYVKQPTRHTSLILNTVKFLNWFPYGSSEVASGDNQSSSFKNFSFIHSSTRVQMRSRSSAVK